MKDLMGRSFEARLECFASERHSFIALSDETLAGQSGWLEISGDEDEAVKLKFRFLRETKDRFEYAITGTGNAGYYENAALGTSFNGYLGMYHKAAVDNVWKLDFTEFGDSGFWLRDKYGQRVAVDKNPQDGFAHHPDDPGVPRLNVNKGNIARFELVGARLI